MAQTRACPLLIATSANSFEKNQKSNKNQPHKKKIFF
jgi:hypothetical protein